MKTINIKGKEYVTVAERLLHLAKYELYSIETDINFYHDQEMWVVKAKLTIFREGSKYTFTGHAQEIIGEGYINKTSALENCETSAVGRACAMAGIGVIDSVASVDEINKAKSRETYKDDPRPWMSQKQLDATIERFQGGETDVIDKAFTTFKMKKAYRQQLEALKGQAFTDQDQEFMDKIDKDERD